MTMCETNRNCAVRNPSAFGVLFAGMMTLVASTAAAQDRLPMDREIPQGGGIAVVCTGVGFTSREDPRWAEYPLKIEVAGAEGQFLGNVTIAIEREGASLVRVGCGGPWVLARLSPGSYTVSAEYEGETTSQRVNVPGDGQGRVILRFPDAGGTVSPGYTP
jgi:hypothetical protein